MDIAGPLQAFNDARHEDGSPAYAVRLLSERGGMVRTDTGVRLETHRLDHRAVEDVDTLLVAGGDLLMPAHSTASLRAALGPLLAKPRRVGSVCTGAFVLAQLGMLDGLPATTHWAAVRRFAQQHPAVELRPDAIFVTAGHIWTSAGVTAGADMALAMIAADIGHGAALAVARALVLYVKRQGGQSQFSVELQRQTRDARGRFDALHDWLRLHLDADLSVPALAEAARMSPRNFARVYQKETGESPARTVERLRLEAARRLLELAPDSIKTVARRTGFGDDERMRRAFVKNLGVSPQDYRGRFGGRVV
ncbi:transcriptional regulator, AraC family with amidase-like domain [Luteibacter sp. UNCMF366Tsu5.1]|nr:transcriptional regulator, AraC family with amidase-like domain [Luteibacter sp. UNCMF366Tsu5.1]